VVTRPPLSKATLLISHDAQMARERFERAISKSWRMGPGVLPQETSDPNVPLRVQVTLPPGLQTEGRSWLDNPVLHWETSEIECPCKPWVPLARVSTEEPATQTRAQIEVWEEDLVRLWGGDTTNTANTAGRTE
jgi:hypothetical protein